MAFFPCIRFEASILLHFRGQANGMQKWNWDRKFTNCMRLQNELTEMYDLINMLFSICIERKIPLIVENPYSEEHYLRRYWCYPPSIIDKDRRENGDYYKKATQYWFVNCVPENNILLDIANNNAIDCKDAIRFMKKSDYEKTGAKNKKVARSMIHPEYANRFIRRYILD